MKKVLVDSSVWINYFKGKESVSILGQLIDNNLICINELILAEILPFLGQKRETHLIGLLRSVEIKPLHIDWEEIVKFQKLNLAEGINKVGIPDLIIVQNVRDYGCALFTVDKHFELMGKVIEFQRFKASSAGLR